MAKYIVRYGAMRNLGVVETPVSHEQKFFHGDRVVVRTSRGVEIAVVLCAASKERVALAHNLAETPLQFIRVADESDEAKLREQQAGAREDFDRCQRIVRKMAIEMALARVERVFGGERIVVYYVADGRVDFRELVRALAAEFQTRIEMKQIGVRDETKLLADVGDCGREVCCNTYLSSMPPVSMKMAKLQKATLDPTKVSGRCGRLKCCLRYEYEGYDAEPAENSGKANKKESRKGGK
ncbi:MAG: signal peptidase [Thermoguttaceae bacterium]|nr:signal peptidase [Thermoguttaceae bacterium]